MVLVAAVQGDVRTGWDAEVGRQAEAGHQAMAIYWDVIGEADRD